MIHERDFHLDVSDEPRVGLAGMPLHWLSFVLFMTNWRNTVERVVPRAEMQLGAYSLE